jgi:hypothetical protein
MLFSVFPFQKNGVEMVVLQHKINTLNILKLAHKKFAKKDSGLYKIANFSIVLQNTIQHHVKHLTLEIRSINRFLELEIILALYSPLTSSLLTF